MKRSIVITAVITTAICLSIFMLFGFISLSTGFISIPVKEEVMNESGKDSVIHLVSDSKNVKEKDTTLIEHAYIDYFKWNNSHTDTTGIGNVTPPLFVIDIEEFSVEDVPGEIPCDFENEYTATQTLGLTVGFRQLRSKVLTDIHSSSELYESKETFSASHPSTQTPKALSEQRKYKELVDFHGFMKRMTKYNSSQRYHIKALQLGLTIVAFEVFNESGTEIAFGNLGNKMFWELHPPAEKKFASKKLKTKEEETPVMMASLK